MWTLDFWKAVTERAAKTFAQSVLALIVVGKGFDQMDWGQIFSVSGVAALASVLMSIVSGFVGERGTPSLATETIIPGEVKTTPPSPYSSSSKRDATWHGGYPPEGQGPGTGG